MHGQAVHKVIGFTCSSVPRAQRTTSGHTSCVHHRPVRTRGLGGGGGGARGKGVETCERGERVEGC